MTAKTPARAVLLDLLAATMDSMSTWMEAAGDRERGLAWRDEVTARMIAVERYVPYERLVADAATALGLDAHAPARLTSAWREMRPWPDVDAVAQLDMPYAFLTNCSSELAEVAVGRSGLAPAFALSAERIGWYKPQREAYRAAVARLGVTPSDVLFVAGAAYDAVGAHDAGLASVLVARRAPNRPLPDDLRVVTGLAAALADQGGA